MKLYHIIEENDLGKSAEEILSQHFIISRYMLKKIRLYGRLELNGEKFRMIDRPQKVGDELLASFQEDKDAFALELKGKGNPFFPILPKNFILFQDDWLILASKPAKLVTHPCYLHQENSLLQLFHSDEREKFILHPINRLDRDTSGIVLLGKSAFSQYAITNQNLEKVYYAFCHGLFKEKKGHIRLPIAREENSIILRKISEEGQEAHTEYEVIESYEKAQVSLLKIILHTGRTHQIRLHLLSIGHPLVGEGLYGIERIFNPQIFGPTPYLNAKSEEKKKSFEACDWKNYQGVYQLPVEHQGDHAQFSENLDVHLCYHWNHYLNRQALHAKELFFHHPLTQKRLHIIDELPEDLLQLKQALEGFENQ